jgi:hypothetical protein
MLLKIFFSVVAVIVALPLTVVAAPQGHSVTVCDFVKQINILNGRMVRVRGTLMMFDTHPDGATPDYLVATCPDLKNGIVKVKVEYPDAWFLKKPPKGYRVDKDSFLRVQKIVMSTLKDGKVKDRYIATIAGQAYGFPPSSAPPPGLHVTREGSYDAGLVIEGIYDVEVPVQ